MWKYFNLIYLLLFISCNQTIELRSKQFETIDYVDLSCEIKEVVLEALFDSNRYIHFVNLQPEDSIEVVQNFKKVYGFGGVLLKSLSTNVLHLF